MSETHKTIADAPAFPQDSASRGLTKREYFTALAMQGLVAGNCMHYYLEQQAVNIADNLIAELNKPAEGK